MSADVKRLMHERRIARERKDFQAADKIREELAKQDILIEDTPQGSIPIPKRRGGG
jgi:cysteinyl-tRNA synthetase